MMRLWIIAVIATASVIYFFLSGCGQQGPGGESPDSEPTALKRLCSLIIERDPDVIEGHNIFKFDLPYLSARASKLGISLFMGRDGSLLSVDSRPAKLPVGGGH